MVAVGLPSALGTVVDYFEGINRASFSEGFVAVAGNDEAV